MPDNNGGKKDWAAIQRAYNERLKAAAEARRDAANRESDKRIEERLKRERALKREARLRNLERTPTGRIKRVTPKTPTGRWEGYFWGKETWKSKPWNVKRNEAGGKRGGHIRDWYKPLTISDKGGIKFSKVHHEWTTVRRRGDGTITSSKTRVIRSNSKWGVQIKQQGKGGAFVLNGLGDWLRQLAIAKYRMALGAEYFRIAIGHRAKRVFELSFKYHKFYNENTEWKPLAEYTEKKRKRTNTWYGDNKSKLYEHGRLASSLRLTNNSKVTRIETQKVSVARRYKGYTRVHSYVYAGWHNEDNPRGRKWGEKIPQRQFMGFSSSTSFDKVDDFAFKIADRYLFDNVFLAKG